MKGYIFEYYKYVRYPKESLEDIKPHLFYEGAERCLLTFGEYDRLKINNIMQFDRFRDLSELAKKWVGNRQSILLYDWMEKPVVYYAEEETEENGETKVRFGFKDSGSGTFDEHLFLALTELPFSGSLRDDEGLDYDSLLKETKNELDHIIQSEFDFNKGDCRYVILGTLGIFGISILWFCNQYTDVLRIVNSIKHRSRRYGKRMYLSAHTMFSKNPLYNSISDHQLIDLLKGKALVQVTLKKWINKNLEFLGDSRFQNIKHTSGEYDIEMEMEARDVYVCFENIEICDHDKNQYQNNILQTRVTLAQIMDDKFIYDDEEIVSECDSLKDNLENIKSEYEMLRDLMKEKIEKTSGMVDTLDSVLCDYRYNVASAVNQSWADDFSYIFRKNLECIRDVISYKKSYAFDQMDLLRVILNNLKQQTFHIAEANSLNFELPKCHLRYTGQEDCLLYAYIGIIKEILKTAYQLEGVNKQTEIIPLVTVDTVPIIECEMYFDKSFFAEKNEKDQDFKILSLNLPHVTFYEMPVYIQYLYHEVYHYIVPKDREERDYVMGILVASIFFSTFMQYTFVDLFDDCEVEDSVLSYINPVIYKIVRRHYAGIHECVTGFGVCKRKVETDTVLLIDKVYQEEVIQYLINNSSHIRDWTCELYSELNNGSFTEPSLKGLQRYFGETGDMVVFKLKDWFEQEAPKINTFSFQANEYIDKIGKIEDGMEEVSADIPMIELSKMPLEEYLLLYCRCLKNTLKNPEKSENTDWNYEEVKEWVRIGVILDFYEHRGISFEEIKQAFTYKYVARYIHFPNEDIDSIKRDISNRKHEAEEWYGFFEQCRQCYTDRFGLYRKHCRKLAEMYEVRRRLRDYNLNEKCEFYFQKSRNAYESFIRCIQEVEVFDKNVQSAGDCIAAYCTAQKVLQDTLFEENIKLINYFQKQQKLTVLHKINEEQNQKKEVNNQLYKAPSFMKDWKSEVVRKPSGQEWLVPVVYSLKSFWKIMDSATRQLEQSCQKIVKQKECPLWYRGQDNRKYGLIPGIMRSNNTERQNFNYLSQYQRYLYEEFKYRADGAPEVMDRSYFGIADYLALMQHYGVATNLMDWSEDAFTALYFALEKLITHEKKQADTDAAIFVFSPHLYNEARRYMIQHYAKATFCTEPAFLASQKTAACSDGMIPNVAVNYNRDVYDMFLTGNLGYESRNQYGYVREMKLKGKEEMAYLPLAIYTSRLNPRIRSQSGIFVAYNLYAEPSDAFDTYAYMDLEKVQEYYLNCVNRKEGKERFLYKIGIGKDAAKQLAEQLRRLGISKERIYPELSNIGEKVK